MPRMRISGATPSVTSTFTCAGRSRTPGAEPGRVELDEMRQ